MAINNINSNVPKPQVESQKLNQQQQQAQTQANAQTSSQQAATAPRQDSVSLTQSAQNLTQMQKKNNDAPVNQEKVDKLKKAIQNGEYNVNAEKLAQNIAKFEAELFGIK